MPTNDKLFGYTAIISVTPSVGMTLPIMGATFNYGRIGCMVYNNGANTVYMAYGTTCSSANYMTVQIPTFTTWIMPSPIYLGPLCFVRNAGVGTIMITEILIQKGTRY